MVEGSLSADWESNSSDGNDVDDGIGCGVTVLSAVAAALERKRRGGSTTPLTPVTPMTTPAVLFSRPAVDNVSISKKSSESMTDGGRKRLRHAAAKLGPRAPIAPLSVDVVLPARSRSCLSLWPKSLPNDLCVPGSYLTFLAPRLLDPPSMANNGPEAAVGATTDDDMAGAARARA